MRIFPTLIVFLGLLSACTQKQTTTLEKYPLDRGKPTSNVPAKKDTTVILQDVAVQTIAAEKPIIFIRINCDNKRDTIPVNDKRYEATKEACALYDYKVAEMSCKDPLFTSSLNRSDFYTPPQPHEVKFKRIQ
jgi:hypothetical protein